MTTSIIPKKRLSVYCLCLGALTLALAALSVGACGRSTKEGAPASGATAVDATPAPTAVPLDLSLASSYERNGQYAEATAIYEAIAANGTDAEKQRAGLALARLYLEKNDYRAAHDLLVAHPNTGGVERDREEADFLLARSLAGLGDTDQALETYRRYVDERGVAAANARAEMASLLLSLGRVDEAQQEAEAALGSLPESLRPGVLLSTAQGLESADATAAAIAWYERLSEESDSTFRQGAGA